MTGKPHFTALDFTVFSRYYAFNKLKVYGSPVSSKSFSVVFQKTFAYFMSLCHILMILVVISNVFIVFVIVIFDQ